MISWGCQLIPEQMGNPVSALITLSNSCGACPGHTAIGCGTDTCLWMDPPNSRKWFLSLNRPWNDVPPLTETSEQLWERPGASSCTGVSSCTLQLSLSLAPYPKNKYMSRVRNLIKFDNDSLEQQHENVLRRKERREGEGDCGEGEGTEGRTGGEGRGGRRK